MPYCRCVKGQSQRGQRCEGQSQERGAVSWGVHCGLLARVSAWRLWVRGRWSGQKLQRPALMP